MPSYSKFIAMILVSTLVMFVLMYLNTYEIDHVFFSETRAFMSILMGSAMAILMMSFMWKMYKNRIANAVILTASLSVFALSLWLVRSQATVQDVAWMKAMIPHHSIAILTSERAKLSDERVRNLADGIIATQKREIDEMKALIEQLEKHESR